MHRDLRECIGLIVILVSLGLSLRPDSDDAGVWGGPTSMASVGERLYVIQNDRLHRVDETTGGWTVLGDPVWGGMTEMTALGDHLYVVQADALYRIDPTTGAWGRLGQDTWDKTTSITALREALYIIQGGALWRVDPMTGRRVELTGRG